MNTKAGLKKIASWTAVFVVGALVVVYQGCSPGFIAKNAGGSSSLSSNSDGLSDNGDLIVIPGQRTTSIVYSSQIMRNMLSVTGVSKPSGDTTEYWQGKAEVFSESGSTTTVTGPMLMAIAGLAAEVCDDLIDEESSGPDSDRRIFNSVDFSRSPASLGDADLSDAIRRMARSFWGRNETTEELSLLIDGVRTGMSTNSSTRDWIVYSCSGMLSSIDAIQI